jgi:hypothetical protein
MNYHKDETFLARARSRSDIEAIARQLRGAMEPVVGSVYAIDVLDFMQHKMPRLLGYRLEVIPILKEGEEGRAVLMLPRFSGVVV